MYNFLHYLPDILLGVDELAPSSIWAIQVLVELLAESCFIPGGDVLLFLKLALSMSERALLTVFARLTLDPALAQLCLYL